MKHETVRWRKRPFGKLRAGKVPFLRGGSCSGAVATASSRGLSVSRGRIVTSHRSTPV